MRIWGLLIIVLPHNSLNASSMQSAHSSGVSAANILVSGVQGAAKAGDVSQVLGYVTANPQEANLNDQNISQATLSKTTTEPVAAYIKEHSAKREMYKLDPLTDPIFINANAAQDNPEKTMQESLIEEDNVQTETTEEFECEEGGDEYVQKCSKRRVVEIEIIPEKSILSGPRYPQRWYSNKSGQYRCGRGCCSDGTCQKVYDKVITQHRQVKVIKDEWIDDCAVLEDKADQGLCRYVEAQIGGVETRTLTGKVIDPEVGKPETETENITHDSWVENYTYACMYRPKSGCESLRSRGCIQTKSDCIEQVGGVCVAWRQTYKCVTSKKATKRYRSADGKTLFCLTGDCADSDYEVNGELAEALAQMAVLKEAQDDIRANVGIFKGQSRSCRKNCAGFRDCCKNGNGWGVSMHLSECSGEEKELANWRSKKRCTYVGTYCSEKVLGKCIRKKSSFCCFATLLAKLINEQGRRQLGIGFGDVKAPDCRGLTPEELSRIDMSSMDLSELYEDVMEKFKVQPQEHMATGIELERIKENMQHLTKSTTQTANQNPKSL
jgi:hypothetical protein